MEIIDGKKISNQIKEEIKVEVDSLKALGKKKSPFVTNWPRIQFCRSNDTTLA